MTAAVPDPRFRDRLAGALRDYHGQPSHPASQYHREADVLLPLIDAEVEARVQAVLQGHGPRDRVSVDGWGYPVVVRLADGTWPPRPRPEPVDWWGLGSSPEMGPTGMKVGDLRTVAEPPLRWNPDGTWPPRPDVQGVVEW